MAAKIYDAENVEAGPSCEGQLKMSIPSTGVNVGIANAQGADVKSLYILVYGADGKEYFFPLPLQAAIFVRDSLDKCIKDLAN